MSYGAARSTRVYVGNLSSRTRERDLEDAFYKYGHVKRCDLKSGFGFVEFDDDRDAEDAVRSMNNEDLDGRRIIVQFSRGGRQGGASGGGGSMGGSSGGGMGGSSGGGGQRGGMPRGGRGGGYRCTVEGLDGRTSWQDLKDFARAAGNVAYTDVWMDRGKKCGVIEYTSDGDLREALNTLDDTKLDGVYVRLYEDKQKKPTYMDSKSRSRSRSRGGRSPSRSRSRGGGGSRSRSPPRKRSRSRSRSRSPKRSSRARSPSRSRSRSPKKSSRSPKSKNSRSRSRSKSRGRDRSKSKSRGRDRSKSKSKSRSKSRSRSRSKSR